MLMLQHMVRFVKYEHIIECGAVELNLDIGPKWSWCLWNQNEEWKSKLFVLSSKVLYAFVA